MKNLTVISGSLVYISDPKFFAQKTYFFYHFPLWDFGLSFWGKLFRQKLEVFPPFWDSKTSWTNHIYTSNVILGWRSLKWESWYRLLWCALQILLYPAAGIFTCQLFSHWMMKHLNPVLSQTPALRSSLFFPVHSVQGASCGNLASEHICRDTENT